MTQVLLVLAILLALGSGVPALLGARDSNRRQRLGAGLVVAAGVFALCAVAVSALESAGILDATVTAGWLMRACGLDGMQRWFLVPIAILGPCAAVYGTGYWPQASHPENGRKVSLFLGMLVAGLMTIVCARNTWPFLFGWEAMALAAFFLVATEDDNPDVRQASWHYLVATHFTTLSLFAMFSLMRAATGSYDLGPLPASISVSLSNGLFLLALFGFGIKAGVFGLHVWLPGAHANSPSHVSAILSGFVLKIGIFGLIRVLLWLPHPQLWWGGVILALGTTSALYGVVAALGQHDLKRLLAYHSVENIGIILMGLGVALLGRSLGRTDLLILGLAGALLHVWNHCFFKSLLFLAAGSVVHAAHTRTIDQLGGLLRAMPWTGAAFLVGAVAICGLPPLNGFVSELLVYLGLLRLTTHQTGLFWLAGALAAPVLALVGALAVACFVKVFGAVFLGEPRTHAARHAVEAPRSMRVPMAVLGGLCLAIGLASPLLAPLLDGAVSMWTPHAHVRLLAPLGSVSLAALALVLIIALLAFWLAGRLRKTGSTRAVTWDCGYALPTARMQYTAASFADILTSLFDWVLKPVTHLTAPAGRFPRRATFSSHVTDIALDHAIYPLAERGFELLSRLRGLQGGRTQAYIVYIFAALIALLWW